MEERSSQRSPAGGAGSVEKADRGYEACAMKAVWNRTFQNISGSTPRFVTPTMHDAVYARVAGDDRMQEEWTRQRVEG